MTNGDKIRSMTDEELAELFTGMMSKQREAVVKALQARGVAISVGIVEMPALARAAHLKWLRELADDNMKHKH